MFMKLLGMPMLAAMAISAFTPAIAQTTIQERRVVMIDRADLLTAEGRSKIEARIGHAARQVCVSKDRRSIMFMRDTEECRAAAMADARRQLDQRIAAASGEVQIAVVDRATTAR